MPNYKLIRNDQIAVRGTTDRRPPHGLAIYIHERLCPYVTLHHHTTPDFEYSLLLIHTPSHSLQIVFLYRSPGYPINNFFSELQIMSSQIDLHMPLVIMGDFNIDTSNIIYNTKLTQISQLFQCQQLVKEPTNDHGNIIDLVFTNCSYASVLTLESTWSDHKIVFATIPHSSIQVKQPGHLEH